MYNRDLEGRLVNICAAGQSRFRSSGSRPAGCRLQSYKPGCRLSSISARTTITFSAAGYHLIF